MPVWSMMIFYAVCILPVVVIMAIMPYIGRKTVCFGISIPSGCFMDEELVALRKRYALGVIFSGVLFTVIYTTLLFIVSGEAAALLLAALIILYIVVVFALYLYMWKMVRALKEKKGWDAGAKNTVVADTRFSSAKRAVSPAWFMLYVVIILATVLVGLLLYNGMPDRIVQKMDLQGNVLKYAAKSIGLIFFAPAMQAFLSVLFALIYWMMLKTPAVIDPDNPETSSRQNAVFRYRWSAFMVFGGMVILLVFFFTQLSFAQVISLQAQILVPLLGPAIIIIGAIVLSVTTGQSGSRVKMGKKKDGSQIRRDDDSYWKLGSFYVNRDDPTLFVEKRFGVGFTLNFGRPGTIVIIVGFIVFITALLVVTFLLVK